VAGSFSRGRARAQDYAARMAVVNSVVVMAGVAPAA